MKKRLSIGFGQLKRMTKERIMKANGCFIYFLNFGAASRNQTGPLCLGRAGHHQYTIAAYALLLEDSKKSSHKT